jgi:hypothetical protein
VYFKDDKNIDDVLEKAKQKDTMFTAWILAYKQYPEATKFTYAEFLEHVMFNRDTCRWQPRKQGFLIGRL